MRKYVKYVIMEHRISATELVRRLGDVLGKIRYRGDRFVVERNGEAVARIGPVASGAVSSVGEAFRAWTEAAEADPGFAADLETVGRMDRAPESPWDS